MPVISELYIYPVKSLGGIKVNSAELTDRGFKYDRRWMLVDDENRVLTQREHPQMALLRTSVTENGIYVYPKNNPSENILIPFSYFPDKKIVVNIWDDFCEAAIVSDKLNEWFSATLSVPCKLVHMPDDSFRKVDERYAVTKNEITSFSDAYPILIVSQESMNDLNSRLPDELPMTRFRPNMVVAGCEPYEEDTMRHFIINGIDFFGVKLCARCAIPTINQDTAEKAKEPTRTLYTYRKRDNNVYFGQNVLYHGTGVIKVGDRLDVLQKNEASVFESGTSIQQ
jgi:uncharacterized protein